MMRLTEPGHTLPCATGYILQFSLPTPRILAKIHIDGETAGRTLNTRDRIGIASCHTARSSFHDPERKSFGTP